MQALQYAIQIDEGKLNVRRYQSMSTALENENIVVGAWGVPEVYLRPQNRLERDSYS